MGAGERWGRRAAALLVAASGLAPAAPTPAAAAPTAGRLVEVARIPSAMEAATRLLQVDAPARRLFEIGQPIRGRGMRVDAYDLGSLARLGSVSVPDAHSGYGKLAALDELRHRLFVVYPLRVADDGALRTVAGEDRVNQLTRTVFAVAVIDTLRLRLLGAKPIPQVAGPPLELVEGNQTGLKALGYSPAADKLYLVTHLTAGASTLAVSTHGVLLHQIDVPSILGPASSAVDWSYPLPHCPMASARESPGVVFRSAHRPAVYVLCRAGGFGASGQQPLEAPGVVRVTLAGDAQGGVTRFASDFFPLSGNLYLGVAALDPVAERIFVRVDASQTESGIWVFDAGSASWLGFVVTRPLAVAVNPALGRLYALSPAGRGEARAVVATTRGIEVDQGVVVPFSISRETAATMAAADPVGRRILWAGSDDYAVLEDRMPASVRPPPPDPDANTSGLPEGPDTAVTFLGAAQAYGSRLRWVGGWGGVERNVNSLVDNPPLPPPPGIAPPVPGRGTRDLHLARVSRSTLSGGEASATAVGAEPDRDNTDVDLIGYTEWLAGRGGPNLVADRWPYRAVACTDFGGPGDRRDDAADGASVTCRQRDASVAAQAAVRAPLPDAPPGAPQVTVAASRAATGARRDPVRGIVSVAEAEARGIDLGGLAGIGRLWARAETWAAGRPGTAASSYQRIIEDAWVATPAGRRQVCTSPCSPEAVRDALNSALGARARVDLPSPDPLRARGTPGGYEALVVRDAFEQNNERALNDELGVRLEVPALVVTLFADGRVRSRVVASFAAVSAESHYGIYRLARAQAPDVLGPAAPPRLLPPPAGPVGPVLKAPPLLATPPAAPLFGQGVAAALRRTFAGLRLIVSQPATAARAFGLWLFLAAPLVLWLRRRPGG